MSFKQRSISFHEKLMQMLAVDEGLRHWVYTDTTGHKTVGVGFNLDNPSAWKIWHRADIPEDMYNVKDGLQPLSYTSIIKLLEISIQFAIEDIKKLVPDFDNLSENRQMALINMSFQLGYIELSAFTKMLAAINAKDFAAAKRHALDSLWAKQTPQRAARVTEMILQG